MPWLKFSGIVLFLLMCGASYSYAQAEDSIALQRSTGVVVTPETQLIEVEGSQDRPNTAALYSAALPGLGQIYNNKYWKLPIIYGGGMIIAYFLNYNNQLYLQYRNSLIALTDGDPRTQPWDPRFDANTYERLADNWRRNRDLLIVVSIAVYALVIVDAHVDAHLDAFRISDDLSLDLRPSHQSLTYGQQFIGCSLVLNIGR